MGSNIFYVHATSRDDVLHYVYSVGLPNNSLSVIIIRSQDLNSSISLECEHSTSDSHINFIGNVEAAFGLLITKLYEYKDTDDKANMNSNSWKEYEFSSFNWQASIIDGDNFYFKTSSMNSTGTILSKGFIEIRFNVSNTTQYGEMPRLSFTGNNTQIEVILSNLTTTFSNSRFAVEVALLNMLNDGGNKVEIKNFFDDELSPGIFQTKNFNGQNTSVSWKNSTYLQWKPVCFTSPTLVSLDAYSIVKDYPPIKVHSNYSDAKKLRFLGSNIFNGSHSISLLNVSFGMPSDKFYNNKNYVRWTFSFGQGIAPTYNLTLSTILIISFGLGLPFIIVVFVSIFLFIKKRRPRDSLYQQMEESILS